MTTRVSPKGNVMVNAAWLMLLFALLCAGCATDTGFYVETENIPIGRNDQSGELSSHSADGLNSVSAVQHQVGVERSFGLPDVLDVVSPRPRSALIGRWRCNMRIDVRSACWGGYILGHLRFCEEYEFREDGSYSKWRVSENNDMIMLTTEEKGRWEYEGGNLRIKREYGIGHFGIVACSFTMSGKSYMPDRQNLQREPVLDWRLQWHSNSEFIVKYANAVAGGTDDVVGPFGEIGRCDLEGCFRSGNAAIGDIVVAPLRFRKVTR